MEKSLFLSIYLSNRRYFKKERNSSNKNACEYSAPRLPSQSKFFLVLKQRGFLKCQHWLEILDAVPLITFYIGFSFPSSLFPLSQQIFNAHLLRVLKHQQSMWQQGCCFHGVSSRARERRYWLRTSSWTGVPVKVKSPCGMPDLRRINWDVIICVKKRFNHLLKKKKSQKDSL